MSKLSNILVPIDFSEGSGGALAYAGTLANQFGAKVTLLFVCQAHFYASEFGHMPMEEAAMCEDSCERLRSFAAGKIDPGLLGEMLVCNGVPFAEITKTAIERQMDMIVISTRGCKGLKHVLMGSTAERVVRHACCPVLVVRDSVPAPAQPETLTSQASS